MKKIFRYPLRLVDGLIDRILAVIGLIGLAQFPQFFHQYLQRLGGHLEEARLIIARYITAAEALGLSLEAYMAEHLSSDNQIFVSSGQVMTDLVQRLQQLEASFLALKQAGPFNRWWVFLREMEKPIVVETWQNFTPGIPTTLEGLCYGLAGLLVVWGLYQGLKSLLLFLGRKTASLFQSPPREPGLPV